MFGLGAIIIGFSTIFNIYTHLDDKWEQKGEYFNSFSAGGGAAGTVSATKGFKGSGLAGGDLCLYFPVKDKVYLGAAAVAHVGAINDFDRFVWRQVAGSARYYLRERGQGIFVRGDLGFSEFHFASAETSSVGVQGGLGIASQVQTISGEFSINYFNSDYGKFGRANAVVASVGVVF